MDAVVEQIGVAGQAGSGIETFFDTAANELDEFRRACAALQKLAEERGIDVALSCATE